ncbi:hypothetical protein P9B03_02225 [Metasolibacillus meyeri]|uniref:Uncharacterized protein n=1 Tax=Metasolibacillus meyeri TaxID=1071052 RepID=A0AAW9NHR7_9BACL|nr:hypothetical protein [Metasolibacillus meyeri]MEC1177287.1 hypothetical protein [Metasolibacillus meyeri]
MDVIRCHNDICKKELDEGMQIEYSVEYGEYYCSLECAIESYVDRARNQILADHLHEKHHNDIEFQRGKLIRKN